VYTFAIVTVILLIILVFCLYCVAHSYVFYPMWVLSGSDDEARTQVQNADKGSAPPLHPPVFVLMAAPNEEAVLKEKLAGLGAQDYPGPMVFYVGSDCSTDRTNQILKTWSARDPRLRITLFTTRQGKPNIINQLAATAGSEGVFVLTDASVMLRPDTISALVRPMTNDQRIGVVDATMVQTGGKAEGIGRAETTYINREVTIKRAEGRRWGAMIGPFGGCWAIRASAFRPVPGNFLVDDFYLCMAAYEAGWRGVSSEHAIVYEGVGQSIKDEFRRKVRISSGNWQNLVRFRQLWWPPFKNPLAFVFFSHKILRWWTPFFVLTGAICVLLLLLTLGNHWATPLFALLLGLVPALAAADFALAALGIHLRVLRGLRYFLAMNAALLVGFFRYLTGIKSNVWQPTQRH
jgi:cellulose synthase/poly-beta-1,6-N-acetylglucosamine synthase-like glycosyltransferase